jgi:hypothetical protein
LCFGVDNLPQDAADLADGDYPVSIGGGRGRQSAFVPGPRPHDVLLECTEFRRREDVDQTPGWLASGDPRWS